MQLSVEDFETLIHTLRPMGMRRASDRRLHLRAGTDAEVTIVPVDKGRQPRPISVHVVDVSRRGIAIRHTRPIEAGRHFILCLSVIGGEKTRAIMCVVRRMEKTRGNHYQMGCEFTSTVHSEVPTDNILPGLKDFQVKKFNDELDAA